MTTLTEFDVRTPDGDNGEQPTDPDGSPADASFEEVRVFAARGTGSVVLSSRGHGSYQPTVRKVVPLGTSADAARIQAAVDSGVERVILGPGTFVVASPIDLSGAHDLVIEGSPGTILLSTMSPVGNQLNSVFYSEPTLGASTTTASANTPGASTLSLTASVSVGDIIRVRDVTDIIQIDYFVVRAVSGAGPYTVTVDRVVQRTFGSGSLVHVVTARLERLTIKGNGMRIRGTGDRGIENIGALDCVISDVHIEPNDAGDCFADCGMSWDTGSRNCSFVRCSVDGGQFTEYGMLLETNDHNTLVDCYATRCTRVGILITDCYHTEARHCHAYNNTTKSGAEAFTATAATDIITYSTDWKSLSKCQFTTTGTLPAGLSLATDYWIVRQSATTAKVATSWANAVAGTYVDITGAGTGTHTLTIAADGIGFYASNDGGTTEGNVELSFIDCSSWANALDGWQLGYNDRPKLIGCVAQYNGRHGFWFGGAQGTRGAMATNCSARANTQHGFNVDSSCVRTKLVACETQSNLNCGVVADSDVTITDCALRLDATSAVYVTSGAHTVTLRGCTLLGPSSGSAQSCVFYSGTGRLVLRDTTVSTTLAGSIGVRHGAASTVIFENVDLIAAGGSSYGYYQTVTGTVAYASERFVHSTNATPITLDAGGKLYLSNIVGAGTPEGAVTASIGSTFLRNDGGAATTLYVKTSTNGNTGWTAK